MRRVRNDLPDGDLYSPPWETTHGCAVIAVQIRLDLSLWLFTSPICYAVDFLSDLVNVNQLAEANSASFPNVLSKSAPRGLQTKFILKWRKICTESTNT